MSDIFRSWAINLQPNAVQRFPENIIKFNTNESTLVPLNYKVPHKVYICNLDIDFDGIWGSNFLEHYQYIVDITNFETIPLYKVTDNKTPVAKIRGNGRQFKKFIIQFQ